MDFLALHGGDVFRYKDVIDFSANINPLGIPTNIKRALCRNIDRILHYPDITSYSITQRIAEYWGIDSENILLGNGSASLIYLLAFYYKPKNVAIPCPTFSEYELGVRNIGSKIHFLKLKEEDGFEFKEGSFGKPDILFLCNPNNPTGNLIFKDASGLYGFANRLIVDECFMDFLPNQKDYTLIWRAIKDERIIVLRSLTKFFSLPGLRIGYLIGHKEIVSKIRKYQPPWSINTLAQIAGELILNDKEYIEKTHRLIEKERKFLFRQLKIIKGLKPYPSVCNFLLIKIETQSITSKSLKEALIKKGILIRNCSNFRGLSDRYIRVAIRTRHENQKLLIALRDVINGADISS